VRVERITEQYGEIAGLSRGIRASVEGPVVLCSTSELVRIRSACAEFALTLAGYRAGQHSHLHTRNRPGQNALFAIPGSRQYSERMRNDGPTLQPDRVSGDDAFDRKLMSYADFAILVGSSEASIKEAVSNGSLLAVNRTNPGGSTESGVAGFQARPEIRGAPLARVLSALTYRQLAVSDSVTAASAYLFFIGKSDLLGDLTPIEVLTGVAPARSADPEVLEFLSKPDVERLELVIEVAKSVAATITGWG